MRTSLPRPSCSCCLSSCAWPPTWPSSTTTPAQWGLTAKTQDESIEAWHAVARGDRLTRDSILYRLDETGLHFVDERRSLTALAREDPSGYAAILRTNAGELGTIGDGWTLVPIPVTALAVWALWLRRRLRRGAGRRGGERAAGRHLAGLLRAAPLPGAHGGDGDRCCRASGWRLSGAGGGRGRRPACWACAWWRRSSSSTGRGGLGAPGRLHRPAPGRGVDRRPLGARTGGRHAQHGHRLLRRAAHGGAAYWPLDDVVRFARHYGARTWWPTRPTSAGSAPNWRRCSPTTRSTACASSTRSAPRGARPGVRARPGAAAVRRPWPGARLHGRRLTAVPLSGAARPGRPAGFRGREGSPGNRLRPRRAGPLDGSGRRGQRAAGGGRRRTPARRSATTPAATRPMTAGGHGDHARAPRTEPNVPGPDHAPSTTSPSTHAWTPNAAAGTAPPTARGPRRGRRRPAAGPGRCTGTGPERTRPARRLVEPQRRATNTVMRRRAATRITSTRRGARRPRRRRPRLRPRRRGRGPLTGGVAAAAVHQRCRRPAPPGSAPRCHRQLELRRAVAHPRPRTARRRPGNCSRKRSGSGHEAGRLLGLGAGRVTALARHALTHPVGHPTTRASDSQGDRPRPPGRRGRDALSPAPKIS